MSFPRYPECKDSGVEWLGQVPVHWYIKTLKYVATYNDEVLPESTSKDYPIKYVEISDVDEQLGITKWTEYPFASAPSRARRILKDGDVLISTVRTYLRAIAPVTEPPDGLVGSTGFAVIRPVPGIYYSGLLGYVIRAEWFISNIISRSVGVSYPAINASDLVALSLPVPPWKEQKTIAHFLDHETAKIDTLIHEQKRLIELLKEKRQAVISHAVTKGLDPDVPMKDSGVEWLGEVPAHWACMSFRYATRILRGKFGHRPRNDPALYDGAYPFIQTGDVARAEKYISEFKQTLNEKGAAVSASFPSGTLVMAIAANIGDTAILGFEAYAPDSVVGFQPRQDITLEFLKYSLDSSIQELEKTSTQSTQANLNIDRVGGVKGVFPPEDEQTKIVSFLDKMCEQFSILEKQATKSIALMVERRSALISAAVTGKIDVRDWQPPADESAFDEKVRQAGMEAEA